MSAVMATKMCKAVSIPPSKNPEELCYQIFFICMVKDELKQLRNLRRINPYMHCRLPESAHTIISYNLSSKIKCCGTKLLEY